MRRLISFHLSVLSLVMIMGCNRAQEQDSAAEDLAFESRIDSAWGMVRNYRNLVQAGKAGDIEDPQKAFAEEFFDYYLEHPNTRIGLQALTSAFAMWGNIGESDEVDRAIAKIDVHSNVWPHIMTGIENSYIRDGRVNDFAQLLKEWSHELTHPYSQTVTFNRLGYYHFQQNEPERARSFFEKVIDLNAVPFYVEMAEGYLYEIDSLSVGQTAPDFEATDTAGNKIVLSGLRGKIVLLDFWATWCAPCMPLIPHLKKIYSDHKNEYFRIIGISLDSDLSALTSFVQKEEMAWPQIFEPEKWEGELVKLYNIRQLPSAYLIDRDGIIVAKHLPIETLASFIDRLLQGSQISSR